MNWGVQKNKIRKKKWEIAEISGGAKVLGITNMENDVKTAIYIAMITIHNTVTVCFQ